jgi:hypothetical protein
MPVVNAANRMDRVYVELSFLVGSMLQPIEETHSPTTTISGPSWGATGMGW